MPSYLLDTNIVSALMRGERQVQERLLKENPGSVYLAQPVIAEVRYGLARLPRSRRRAARADRFELLAGAIPRANWSDEVSAIYGTVKTALELYGERLEDFDIAIAAYALALDVTLATRNEKHFTRISDLKTESW
ncbi:MAG: type II toxin-antitoxin system VapC family toxin [Acidobacteriota bacterium]